MPEWLGYLLTDCLCCRTWCDVEATVGCSDPFEIKYTLDDSDPVASASAVVYSKPFVVAVNATIRATPKAAAMW